jgi:hypothetical protein
MNVRRLWVTACLAGLLAGCAPAPLGDSAAQELQDGVLAVTEAASEGRYRAALTELDGLSEQLDTATAAGAVTFSRHQQIRAAMERVRAQLEASLGTAAPRPSPSPSSSASESAEPTEPVEPVEPLPAPLEEIGGEDTEDPEDSEDDSGDDGEESGSDGGPGGEAGPPDHAGDGRDNAGGSKGGKGKDG